MKHTLLIASLLVMNLCIAQDISKDTLRLNGVMVGKNHKPKIKKQEIGGCTHYGALDHPQEIITLIDKLPKGSLYSVTFSFNNPYRKNPAKFGDNELELVFYEVMKDGTPGPMIASKKVLVAKDHRGDMEIDVTGLAIGSENDLFVGLKKLTGLTSPVPNFEVHCVCSRNDKFKSYGRFYVQGNAKQWVELTIPAAIKMTVKTDAQ